MSSLNSGRAVPTVLTWSLAATPVAWLALFGLFILRARLALGAWPQPYTPDPKDLGFDLHHAALVLGMPLMFTAVLAVTALAFLGHRGVRRSRLAPLTAAVGLGVVLLLARIDPGNVFMWLGD
jgi:hypothetical protein